MSGAPGSSLPRVVLAQGRDAPIRGRHPWIFSGAVARVEGDAQDGDEVEVVGASGEFLARGLFNGRSQIRVRSYSWDPDQGVDNALLDRRIARAVAVRAQAGLMEPEGGCRLVFSESDGLSGLVVDRYGDWLTVQFTSLALWERREPLLEALRRHVAPRGIILRTEKGILEEEGLEIADGLLEGEEPAGPITILENGIRYRVDVRTGQKTGFYLDQRDNRLRAARYARGRRAADVCCYTGAFALHLLRAGATSVVGVDVSRSALELARVNLEANGFPGARARFEDGDAFKWLEQAHEEEERFGMIVLDPPRMARSERGMKGALRGYLRLNEAAVRCLDPGGVLVTCSCTGRISRERFLGILAEVEVRTGRRIRVLEQHGQPADHPVSPTCPETAYLKCLIAQVE